MLHLSYAQDRWRPRDRHSNRDPPNRRRRARTTTYVRTQVTATNRVRGASGLRQVTGSASPVFLRRAPVPSAMAPFNRTRHRELGGRGHGWLPPRSASIARTKVRHLREQEGSHRLGAGRTLGDSKRGNQGGTWVPDVPREPARQAIEQGSSRGGAPPQVCRPEPALEASRGLLSYRKNRRPFAAHYRCAPRFSPAPYLRPFRSLAFRAR